MSCRCLGSTRPCRQTTTDLGWWITLLVLAVGGCSSKLASTPNPIEIDTAEYSRMYNAALQVLRDHGFRLDRRSHRFGKITTRYLASPTVLEPWHTTNTTAEQAWESTLNDQRRMVTVLLEPVDPINADLPTPPTEDDLPSGYRMHVEVYVERRQSPNRRLTGSTSGHHVFGVLSSTPAELVERGIDGPYWQSLGRDPYLEQRLLAAIVRRSLTTEGPSLHLEGL